MLSPGRRGPFQRLLRSETGLLDIVQARYPPREACKREKLNLNSALLTVSKRTLISSGRSCLSSATDLLRPRMKLSPSSLGARTKSSSWRRSLTENGCSSICGEVRLSGSTALERPRTTVSLGRQAHLIIAYLYGAHPGEGSLTQYISDAFHEDVRK